MSVRLSRAFAPAAFALSARALADLVAILFVGNSYTFGRVDPVSTSARNAVTLRGHYLNTANPGNRDLRGNIASRRWDVVVLQEQSDAALPAGRGKNANLPQFNAVRSNACH
jgi:hypothetical protein